MSDAPRDTSAADQPRRRDHLRIVSDEPIVAVGEVPPPRPRTIGRLIAQTALIADSAVTRRRLDPADDPRGMAGRLLGRFR